MSQCSNQPNKTEAAMGVNLWQQHEFDYLIANYPNVKISELSNHLGRSKQAINTKAHILKLKRSPEFIKEQLKGGIKCRFKKGNVPYNKGKKHAEYLNEDSIKNIISSQFRKGNEPHNTRSNGEISLRCDKSGKRYQYIRIEKKNWKLLHVHIWKQHNGKIPNGYCVVFKDKNSLNCQIENLECISRIELMSRNTIQRYPTELKKTLKLLKNVKSKLESSK